MGFISGLAIGQREEQIGSGLLRSANPVASLAAISAARSRGGGGGGRAPRQNINPSAIHQKAAEMVLEEKRLENERIQAQINLFNAQANTANQTRRRKALGIDETADQFTTRREGEINTEYDAGIKRSKDWQGAQDRQLEAGKDIQRQDYKKAMAGLFQGNGDGMKNYINRYGDPNANVDSIQFNPNGSGEILVTPAKGADGKEQKAMAFKDLEQFSTAYALFLHPDSAGMLSQGTKGNNAGLNLSPDDISKIDERSAKQWDEDNKDIVKGPLSKEDQAKKQDFIVTNRNSAIALASRGQGAVLRGGPKQVEETGAPAKTGPTVVKSGVDKKTGKRVNMMSDGTIVPADAPPAGTGSGGYFNDEAAQPGAIKGGASATSQKIGKPKVEDLNRQVEEQKKIPGRLAVAGELMNKGKSAYDAFKEAFGDEFEEKEKESDNARSDEDYGATY
jgi:hypothetical protein